VIVAYEDMLSWAYDGNAARIADKLFEDLDAPVRRVAAWIPSALISQSWRRDPAPDEPHRGGREAASGVLSRLALDYFARKLFRPHLR